jgi:type II secretory ATPase GspE/PulE/Tfp pilus assembly ATPase PilB-like protein
MQLRDVRGVISRATLPSFLHRPKEPTGVSVAVVNECDVFVEAEQSIVRLVEILIARAYLARASDIHLDPRTEHLSVRFRIDGVLQDTYTLPVRLHAEIISRIKILSGLRIDEHYSAQDGRFRIEMGRETGEMHQVDVRVSVVPTYYGENAVLRLLAESVEAYTLESLGITPHNRDKILRALSRPHGMILTTGPTGSGKTTSMYTMLKILNQPGVSIVTLEDPIEYSIPGVSQIQINPKSGLTFGTGLRSILRQDPNVIMVGEIRDHETAGLATNTALTGHRILSTLHTNDAATTIPRLLDMGVESYLIASTLQLAIGQRLVRRLCDICKQPHTMSEQEVASLDDMFSTTPIEIGEVFFVPVGCHVCQGTGYRGRVGIYEVIEMNESLRTAILARADTHTIRTVARETGMISLYADGLQKVRNGSTSLAEILSMRYE